jgi:hypothetical protein
VRLATQRHPVPGFYSASRTGALAVMFEHESRSPWLRSVLRHSAMARARRGSVRLFFVARRLPPSALWGALDLHRGAFLVGLSP